MSGTRLYHALAMVFGLLIVGSVQGDQNTAATAPGEFWCMTCQDHGDTEHHAFAPTGAYFRCMPGLNCHTDWWSDFCGDGHNACSSEGKCDPSCDELALAASVSDDPAAVRAFLTKYKDVVTYSEERKAIQILNCQQQPVANFPVRPALAVALE